MSNTEDKTGYIHQVSKVKLSTRSTSKYFHAVLQHQEGFTDMVVFSPEKHTIFHSAEQNKTPVKLLNLKSVVSRRNTTKEEFQFGTQSKLSTVTRKLDFAYDPSYAKTMTVKIADIDNMSPYERLDTVAKVLTVNETSSHTVPSGQTMNCQHCMIADETKAIRMSVWGSDIDKIEEGHTFKFSNLSVRSFMNQRSLTSTRETSIIPCQDIKSTAPLPPEEQLKELKGKIVGSDVTIRHICTCNRPITDTINVAAFSFKCFNCKMLIPTTEIRHITRATINLKTENDQIHKLTLNEDILKQLFPPHIDLTDKDTMEDLLLRVPIQTYKVHNFVIKSVLQD